MKTTIIARRIAKIYQGSYGDGRINGTGCTAVAKGSIPNARDYLGNILYTYYKKSRIFVEGSDVLLGWGAAHRLSDFDRDLTRNLCVVSRSVFGIPLIPYKSKCFYYCRFYFNRNLMGRSTYGFCFYYAHSWPQPSMLVQVMFIWLGYAYIWNIKWKSIPIQFSCQFKSKAQLAKV